MALTLVAEPRMASTVNLSVENCILRLMGGGEVSGEGFGTMTVCLMMPMEMKMI